ncbi:HelD family protein [Antribacter gilvus]|uniref:HelD family protein n=1 Tax=Antribacter gilvus TaxID=2304675 RepID=UPI001F0C5CCE|nr:ATP-binding domain-containing protein [Antribacter gilvus]
MPHRTDPTTSPLTRQTAAEQTHVDRMYATLDHAREGARTALGSALREPSDGPAELHAREATVARLTQRLRRLEDAEHGLCFGRVDTTGGTALHVGRLGLQHPDRPDPLLVDWRADAARPFYAATPAEPLGLRRRRHLRLDARTVREVSDEVLDGSDPGGDDVVGDGPLVEALAAARTGQMRDAAATLQAEQDAIVRSEHRGVTVVQGGPGTAKTVVALHRAAYVLYAFPGVADQGVLVVGPNARFLDYIAHVLPSLGENDVLLATVGDLALGNLAAASPARREVGADGAGGDAGHHEVRIKGRPALAEALAGMVRARQAPSGGLSVPVGGDPVVLGEQVVADARERATGSGLAHNRARAVFKEHLAEMLVRAVEAQAVDQLARLEAEVSQMTGMDFDRAAAADLRALGLDDTPRSDLSEEFDPDALRDELETDPAFDRAVEGLWPRLDATDLVRDFLEEPRAPGLSADDAEVIRWRGTWTVADAPLLDEAAELVDGPPARTFGHVVVDEAQELTPLQWRAVLRRCPARSLTVVGDFAQAGPATEAGGWDEAVAPHVGERYEVRTLSVNYRTTTEILEATRALLAHIAPAQELSRSLRHGEPPRVLACAADEAATTLRSVLDEEAEAHPEDLVGVVCAEGAAARLADLVERAGARLVPAPQARGLEFDTVVVVDPDLIASARPGGERDLYVALTRATKRLVRLGVGA